MRKAKYRITNVRIEGFRGFTKPQTMELAEQSVFVFGPNGCGKSSIIEAIRWCLFGSPAGKDIEVRNTFYEKGECTVILVLTGPDETLEVRRELRPGATRSRQTITDSSGGTVLERDALPQLARIGQREGTQVIFAAQQAVGRQAQVDISDFTRVLFFYLHLESVPELLERLGKIIEERSEEANEMAAQIEKREGEYRESLREFKAKLNELLDNPPWGDGPAPAGNETTSRISSFVREQAQLYEQDVPSSSSGDVLTQVMRWIDDTTTHKTDELSQRLVDLQEKLKQAEDSLSMLRGCEQERALVERELSEAHESLSTLLSGTSPEDLQRQLGELEAAMSERDGRLDLARRAQHLCQGHNIDRCLICDSELGREVLIGAIAERIRENEGSDDSAIRIESLRVQIDKINDTKVLIDKYKGQLTQLSEKVQGVREAISDASGADIAKLGVPEASTRVAEIRENVESIRRQIADADAERSRRAKAARDLREELRYHEYRDQVEHLESQLGPDLNEARGILEEYRELLATCKEIRTIVEEAFNEAFDRATPRLNEMMTEVYSRLTKQVSYEQVSVKRVPEQAGRVELRVASSRLLGQTFPVNVLNGQAARALRLVPYFVFSRFQPEVMELDLLLIDDPSESFDTSHIESLMEELAEASKHAQLIVATHERNKFEPYLPNVFQDEPYTVLVVEHFDPVEGPKIGD